MMMKMRKKTLPVLKGSVARGALAVGVSGSRSHFPLLPCPLLGGLWDRWSMTEGATLNSLNLWLDVTWSVVVCCTWLHTFEVHPLVQPVPSLR